MSDKENSDSKLCPDCLEEIIKDGNDCKLCGDKFHSRVDELTVKCGQCSRTFLNKVWKCPVCGGKTFIPHDRSEIKKIIASNNLHLLILFSMISLLVFVLFFADESPLYIPIIFSMLAIYMIPSMFGWRTIYSRRIFYLNLFLGWTLLGWIAAMVWAITAPKNYD